MSESITLYCRDGSSDKIYMASITQKDAGYVVNFQYGRRGSSLACGSKTPQPVPLEKAQTVYSKLVKEKLAKGYTPGEDGQAYAGTADAGRVSGHLPQLLNAIDIDTEVDQYLHNREHLMQIKYDGERRIVIYDHGQVTGVNRKGLFVALSQEVVDAVVGLLEGSAITQAVFDGEDLGSNYVAFDLLAANGVDLRDRGFEERIEALSDIFTSSHNGSPMIFAAAAYSPQKKRMAYRLAISESQEGVVFKHRTSRYEPGRPNSGGPALKAKFVATATVRVTGVNEGKRSVGMEVLNPATALWRFVGNCTIPANHQVPETGQLVEIRYLYAYPTGCLFQPVYRGVRNDLDVSACVESQLQYKREAKAA